MTYKFDELAKGLAQSATRRQVLKRFGVGPAGMVPACPGLANTARGSATAVILVLAGGTGLAQTPLTFNTGVDYTGTVLNDYSADSHYQLIMSADPRFPGPGTVVVDTTLFPISTGNWLASDGASKWIAPQGNEDYLLDPNNGNAVGNYTYRTTFGLMGFDPELVRLVGQWTCDSVGVDILINGISTSNSIPGNLPVAPQWWHPFVISSGFIQGTNTVDFVVQRINWGGSTYLPTGLCAELSVSNLPPPQIQLGIEGHVVLVWWPTNVPAFRMETSPRLGANQSWTAFAGPITVVGDQNLVAVEATGASRFLRLHKP